MRVALAVVILAICIVLGLGNPTNYGIDARAGVRTLHSERASGSGVVLAPGVVLTAAHVATAVDDLVIESGRTVATVVQKGNDVLDLAVVTFPVADAPCPCVRLASYEAERDEPVYVVGYPLGLTQVVTLGTSQGVYSGAGWTYGRRLIVTASVAGGSSGGGVFVLRKGRFELVGILVEGSGNLAFAVTLADIRAFLNMDV